MLEGKVAVVTGGTRGIGYAIVEKFLENGAQVILFGSRKETVNNALETLRKKYSKVDGFYPKLTDEKELSSVFQQIKDTYGHIDILVNNAGISSKTKLEDYTEEEYDKVSDLNIKSVFTCSKVILPYLKETKGVILNTSSMVSIYGQPSGVMYPTSKFAVNGMTKSLARELAPEPLIQTIPLGRIGKPEDIANAFVFLASDMASYISGVVLSVDGLART